MTSVEQDKGWVANYPMLAIRRRLVEPSLTVIVAHHPAPQGSKVPGGRASSGRIVMRESSKYVTPWREAVKEAARRAAGVDEVTGILPSPFPLDGTLIGEAIFTLPKPKAAPKNRVTYPATHRNDTSKLLRSTEDALKDGGLIVDDGLFVEYLRLAKVFPNEDEDALGYPGAIVRVWALSEVSGGQ